MKTRRLAVLALGSALALSGCAALTEESATGDSDEQTVAVGLYPLQYVAQRVAGDAFTVKNLTAPGGEPHDLELGVGETATVADADLLIYVDSLQPAVDDAATETATGDVLDVATVVDLIPFDDEEAHAHEEHAEDHAEEDHAEEDHAEEEGAEHDHGEHDPHFWQDPLRMADLGDAVADELAGLDPDHADDFTANAAALRTDLEELDASYADGLADCAIDTVVTNHDAFGYLAKYGLHLESITGITPDAEPTPAALADLQELIDSDQITTVFSESLVSEKNAQTLARDAGVRTEVLDTIEGLSDETADDDYLSLMRENLTKLEQANRC